MTAPPLSDQVKAFFDEFVEAFATFDGSYIARRYAVPYLAMHADGSTELFHSTTAIGEYFQRVVDEYRARDCRSCRYIDLAVVGIGRSAALGTVTWELCARTEAGDRTSATSLSRDGASSCRGASPIIWLNRMG